MMTYIRKDMHTYIHKHANEARNDQSYTSNTDQYGVSVSGKAKS